jgi:hypothetical protein
LTIIAGGGVDGDAVVRIGSETSIREFHVGRAARDQFRVEGSVKASLVSELVNRLPRVLA